MKLSLVEPSAGARQPFSFFFSFFNRRLRYSGSNFHPVSPSAANNMKTGTFGFGGSVSANKSRRSASYSCNAAHRQSEWSVRVLGVSRVLHDGRCVPQELVLVPLRDRILFCFVFFWLTADAGRWLERSSQRCQRRPWGPWHVAPAASTRSASSPCPRWARPEPFSTTPFLRPWTRTRTTPFYDQEPRVDMEVATSIILNCFARGGQGDGRGSYSLRKKTTKEKREKQAVDNRRPSFLRPC